jgi:hypothetical protein
LAILNVDLHQQSLKCCDKSVTMTGDRKHDMIGTLAKEEEKAPDRYIYATYFYCKSGLIAALSDLSI